MFNLLSKNYWYIKEHLSDEMMSDLDLSISNLKKEKTTEVNHLLAGKIEEEYFIEIPDSIKSFIFKTISNNKDEITRSGLNVGELEKFSYLTNVDTNSSRIRSWVNFQKKYEYNPVHNHSGDFSYVIWYRIPYTSTNEILKGPGSKANSKTNGSFTFYFVNDKNEIECRQLTNTKSKEGTLLIFPSKLYHSVNPFYTSDEYRITLSGNINEIRTPYNII